MHDEKRPERPSEEADRNQLEFAKKEGEAYARSLAYMTDVVAHTGGLKSAGDMMVGFAQEKAEGMYMLRDGKLEWVEPAEGENCHIEITAIDASDQRFIPGLDIKLTVIDESGREIGSHSMPFLWHPGLYHYGRNWHLPGDGRYTFVVDIATPGFPRHDKKNGCRYTEPVQVTFENVEVKTARD